MRKLLLYTFLLLLLFSSNSYSKSVLDVISENKDLSIFHSYLQKTGLDRVLAKKLPGIGLFLHQVIKLLLRLQPFWRMKY